MGQCPAGTEASCAAGVTACLGVSLLVTGACYQSREGRKLLVTKQGLLLRAYHELKLMLAQGQFGSSECHLFRDPLRLIRPLAPVTLCQAACFTVFSTCHYPLPDSPLLPVHLPGPPFRTETPMAAEPLCLAYHSVLST